MAYVTRSCLNWKATDVASCKFNVCFALVAVGNSQPANQTEELRLKCEITLERVAISVRSEMLLTILLGSTQNFTRLFTCFFSGRGTGSPHICLRYEQKINLPFRACVCVFWRSF